VPLDGRVMTRAVRETHAMLRDMNPVLDPQTFVFCTAIDPALIERAQATALACFARTKAFR
jgi:hypothetical protein